MRNILSILALTSVCAFVFLGGCGNTEEATVTRVYQPIRSGMVHTWLSVKFDDQTTAEVMLPDDDKIWDIARNMRGKKVALRKQGDKWKFVEFQK